MLLDEFDPSKTAVINPWDLIKEIDQIPKTAIACSGRNHRRDEYRKW